MGRLRMATTGLYEVELPTANSGNAAHLKKNNIWTNFNISAVVRFLCWQLNFSYIAIRNRPINVSHRLVQYFSKLCFKHLNQNLNFQVYTSWI